jgi:hypothetical protein
MWSILRRLLLSSLILGALGAGCTSEPMAVPPSGVVVSPAVDTLRGIGAIVQLTASVGGRATTGATAAISWTSLNGGVATVDSLGAVRAVALGTALVVAAVNSESDTATVVVMAPCTLLQLALTPASITLAPGGTGQFAVSGTWCDGSPTVPAVTYSATGGTITAGGLYTAGATPGTFQVIAIQQGGTKTDTSKVTVSLQPPTLTRLLLTPTSITLAPGGTSQFAVSGTWSDGSSTVPAVTFSATGGTITASGLFTAGNTPGVYPVIASQQGGPLADTSTVAIVADPLTHTVSISRNPQWVVYDDGHTVDVDGPVLHVRFAYNGEGVDGWFRGGGGRDGAMVELYYKPTSPTRNLAFRSGLFGGKMESVDYFLAEPAATDQADYTTPDYSSGTEAVMQSHRVWEDAGQLVAEFEFDFMSWHIIRTTVLSPLGDITVSSHIALTTPGNWGYLEHAVHFAVAPITIVNGATYNWGGEYRDDGESYHAWSDMDGGRYPTPFEYIQPLSSSVNTNSVIYDFGRNDHYSGFMLDDRNGNDPDIIVMNGDSTTRVSPFQTVAGPIGGNAYVESGIFSPVWANGGAEGGLNWFYATIRCCPPEYSNPMYWGPRPAWDESFHILLRRNLDSEDYIPLWQARAHNLVRERPTPLGGASVRLDSLDRLYHITAAPGAGSVQFSWVRSVTASRAVDYHTAFMVEGVPAAVSASISGANAPGLQAYRDAATGRVLVLLVGAQPANPAPYTITVGP